MRWFPIVSVVLGLAACKGDGGGKKDSDDTGGDTVPVTVALGSEAEVAKASVAVADAVVAAHRSVNTLLSAAKLVSAETAVRDRLGIDNGGARNHHCWTVPPVVQSVFTIDYLGCNDPISTVGGVEVNDTPLGPVVFEFISLEMNERKLVGALSLDGRDAPPYAWFAFDTQTDAPSPENRSPIAVTTENGLTAVTWDGGASLDMDDERWRLWGVAKVETITEATTVRVGGTDPDALLLAEAPAGAPTSTFDYLECRCPTSGDLAYDMTVGLTEISVDLDALKLEDDGVDDPVLKIDLDRQVTGQAVVTSVGCGEYATAFTSDEGAIVVPVDGQEIVNGIREKCDALVIDDRARCDALLGAAESFDTFTFTVPESQLAASVGVAVSMQFDGPWCKY